MELKEVDNFENKLHLIHLKLEGSNREIGFQLGELARERHRIDKTAKVQPEILKEQVDYLEQHYPQHVERMHGFAEAYGVPLHDHSHDFSCFGRPLGETGCSAVHYPPSLTGHGSPIISRNLDFPIPANYHALDSFPFKHTYMVEMSPDTGYASLSLFCFDVFGLSLEGINDRGLAVIHLADADTRHDHGSSETLQTPRGFNEFLPIQCLLDNCATAEDAISALEQMEHYHAVVPVHLLVADRSGNAFAFEYTPDGRKKIAVHADPEAPFRITNFQLNRLNDPVLLEQMKSRTRENGMDRYDALGHAIDAVRFPAGIDHIRNINAHVYVHNDTETELDRTLFHSIYDLTSSSIRIALLPSKDQSVDTFPEFRLSAES